MTHSLNFWFLNFLGPLEQLPRNISLHAALISTIVIFGSYDAVSSSLTLDAMTAAISVIYVYSVLIPVQVSYELSHPVYLTEHLANAILLRVIYGVVLFLPFYIGLHTFSYELNAWYKQYPGDVAFLLVASFLTVFFYFVSAE